MGRMDAESGEGMITEVQVEGYFAENSFFYIDDATKHGFLIDPGAEAERLLAIIKDNNWRIEKILLTHGISITRGPWRKSETPLPFRYMRLQPLMRTCLIRLRIYRLFVVRRL